MAYPDKDLAAGGTIVGSYAPSELFAGEADVTTEEEFVVAGTGVLEKHLVVAKSTLSYGLVPHVPGGNNGTGIAYGILTQAVDASTQTQRVSVYTGGFFNHTALVWYGSLASLEQRKAIFAGTPIHIGNVRL